ncbi:MAG: hypothetical protein HY291_01680 [Planctomycetes bacterium]|nr:hypothetical protein [Planctomycetota bacterium]
MRTHLIGRWTLFALLLAMLGGQAAFGEVMDKNKDKKDKDKDKPKGRDADETGQLHVTWYPSAADAVAFAKANYVPALVLIYREDNADDVRKVNNIEGWPSVIEASHGQMAATKITAASDEAKPLIERLKIVRYPYVVWIDHENNPVIAFPLTDTAATLTAVVKAWPQTLDSINKFYADHLVQANKYLARGRLRSAYLEYAFLAPFVGKDPAIAHRGMERVKETWLKILEKAKEMPAESSERAALIKGIRRDVQFLDFAPTIEAEIRKAPERVQEKPKAPEAQAADASKPAAQPEPAEKPAPPPEPAAPPQRVVAAPPPPQQDVMPATADKPLVEAMKVQVAPSAYAADTAEDASINLTYLVNHKDPVCKDAGKSFQQALETYKKAINEVKELGAERNKLLETAASSFEKGVNALEKVVEKSPDATIDRIMQQVSMIMYACLKYQSL